MDSSEIGSEIQLPQVEQPRAEIPQQPAPPASEAVPLAETVHRATPAESLHVQPPQAQVFQEHVFQEQGPEWSYASQLEADQQQAQQPQQPWLAAPPTRTRRPLSRVQTLIVGGAVAAMVAGGAFGGYIVHQRQDRNDQAVAAAKAAQGQQPQPLSAGVRSDGSHYGPLFAYLLPVPSGYALGPDVTVYGNDGYYTADQIASGFDDLLSSIPKSDLTNVKGRLASQHLKGVAVRSFVQTSSSQTISIVLRQLDAGAAKNDADTFVSLFTDLNVFRTGPTVPGYPQAKCMLPPGLGSDKFDAMECVAVSGDVEVMVYTQGAAPLDQGAVAQMIAQQLDRLKSPQTLS